MPLPDQIARMLEPVTDDVRLQVLGMANLQYLHGELDSKFRAALEGPNIQLITIGSDYAFCNYAAATIVVFPHNIATFVNLDIRDILFSGEHIWICRDIDALARAVQAHHRAHAERAVMDVFARLSAGPSGAEPPYDLLRGGTDNCTLKVNDWTIVRSHKYGDVGIFRLDLPYRRWQGFVIAMPGERVLRYVDTDNQDEPLLDLAFGLIPGQPVRLAPRSIDELAKGEHPYRPCEVQ